MRLLSLTLTCLALMLLAPALGLSWLVAWLIGWRPSEVEWFDRDN